MTNKYSININRELTDLEEGELVKHEYTVYKSSVHVAKLKLGFKSLDLVWKYISKASNKYCNWYMAQTLGKVISKSSNPLSRERNYSPVVDEDDDFIKCENGIPSPVTDSGDIRGTRSKFCSETQKLVSSWKKPCAYVKPIGLFAGTVLLYFKDLMLLRSSGGEIVQKKTFITSDHIKEAHELVDKYCGFNETISVQEPQQYLKDLCSKSIDIFKDYVKIDSFNTPNSVQTRWAGVSVDHISWKLSLNLGSGYCSLQDNSVDLFAWYLLVAHNHIYENDNARKAAPLIMSPATSSCLDITDKSSLNYPTCLAYELDTTGALSSVIHCNEKLFTGDNGNNNLNPVEIITDIVGINLITII